MYALVDLEERIAHLDIELQILPWRSKLVVVLQNVLVHAVERHRRRYASSADSRLEAVRARYRVIRQNAAVAPAGDCQPVWICNAQHNSLVYAGQQVFDFV